MRPFHSVGDARIVDVLVVSLVVAATIAFRNDDPLATAMKLVTFGALLAVALLQLTSGIPNDSRFPIWKWSVTGIVVLALSGVVAAANSVSLTSWLLDVVAPAAIVVAFPAAFYVGRRASRAALELALVVCALIAGFSYAYYWLTSRRVIDVSALAGIATWYLPLAGAIYVWSRPGLTGRTRAAYVTVILGLLIVSGTRLALLPVTLITLYPVVRGLARGKRGSGSLIKTVLTVFAVAASLGALLNSISGLGVSEGSDRFFSAFDLLSSRGEGDRSFDERAIQNDLALDSVAKNPFLGTGPGYEYTWRTPVTQRPRSSVIAEAPAAVFGDYGLLGGGMLYAYLVMLAMRSGGRLRAGRGGTADEVVIALVVAACGNGFVASPFDDKGLAIALVLALALSAQSAEQGGPADCSPVATGRSTVSRPVAGGRRSARQASLSYGSRTSAGAPASRPR